MRNSVKVVIDAYNGTMSFYVFDQADPMIRTYEKIFPGMFKPQSAMPASLRAHVRYPQDFFRTQAEMFATYHVTNPTLLYNKGNQWQIPTNVSISGAGQMNPYYMIMRLPGQTREEFVLIVPFTPNERTNMIAWLGAESDAPNYGKAVSFDFPSSLSVYGPAQVEAAVNQNPTISAQRTLWGQQGSSVIFGNLSSCPDRGLAALRAAALPGVADDAAAADPARHRLLPLALGRAEPAYGPAAERRHAADARRRPGRYLRRGAFQCFGHACDGTAGARRGAPHRSGRCPVRRGASGPAHWRLDRVRAADRRPRQDTRAASRAAVGEELPCRRRTATLAASAPAVAITGSPSRRLPGGIMTQLRRD